MSRESLADWVESDLKLERPDGSSWHKLQEAIAAGRVGGKPPAMDTAHAAAPQVFVVEHNWAAAFASAGDFEAQVGEEYRLPFGECAFEFRIIGHAPGFSSARRVFVLIGGPDGIPMWDDATIVISNPDGSWTYAPVAYMREQFAANGHVFAQTNIYRLLVEQIRAVCISLDAKVAIHDVVRAPHKLNRAREKKGVPLLADYRVVSLARRRSPERLLREEGTTDQQRRVRLHFRRGHYAHYDRGDRQWKTWRSWTLVGDPDLGFIDKHYKL